MSQPTGVRFSQHSRSDIQRQAGASHSVVLGACRQDLLRSSQEHHRAKEGTPVLGLSMLLSPVVYPHYCPCGLSTLLHQMVCRFGSQGKMGQIQIHEVRMRNQVIE